MRKCIFQDPIWCPEVNNMYLRFKTVQCVVFFDFEYIFSDVCCTKSDFSLTTIEKMSLTVSLKIGIK